MPKPPLQPPARASNSPPAFPALYYTSRHLYTIQVHPFFLQVLPCSENGKLGEARNSNSLFEKTVRNPFLKSDCPIPGRVFRFVRVWRSFRSFFALGFPVFRLCGRGGLTAVWIRNSEQKSESRVMLLVRFTRWYRCWAVRGDWYIRLLGHRAWMGDLSDRYCFYSPLFHQVQNALGYLVMLRRSGSVVTRQSSHMLSHMLSTHAFRTCFRTCFRTYCRACFPHATCRILACMLS